MLERTTEAKSALLAEPAVAHALARAAAAIARLDQAMTGHPLRLAFLYRTRLEAVRLQAAVDAGRLIHGTWPRCFEGFHALRIIDRGVILDAPRHALHLMINAWRNALASMPPGRAARSEALNHSGRACASIFVASPRMGLVVAPSRHDHGSQYISDVFQKELHDGSPSPEAASTVVLSVELQLDVSEPQGLVGED